MRVARIRLVRAPLALARATLTVALVGLTLAGCARMGGPDGMPRRPATVTVSGAGTVAAAPDLAEITTGVLTQAPAAQALAANRQAMERLLQALGGLGIAARDIQTTNISVSPLRRPGKDGQPPEITGYEVSNQVQEAGAAAPRPEMAPRAMMSAAVPVAPGEQEIQTSATVTFTLQP